MVMIAGYHGKYSKKTRINIVKQSNKSKVKELST